MDERPVVRERRLESQRQKGILVDPISLPISRTRAHDLDDLVVADDLDAHDLRCASQLVGIPSVICPPAGSSSPGPTERVTTKQSPLAASTEVGVIVPTRATGVRNCHSRLVCLIQIVASSKIRGWQRGSGMIHPQRADRLSLPAQSM